jgi:hypothetical protein
MESEGRVCLGIDLGIKRRGGEAHALGVVLAEGKGRDHGRKGHAERVPAWKTTENRAFLLA